MISEISVSCVVKKILVQPEIKASESRPTLRIRSTEITGFDDLKSDVTELEDKTVRVTCLQKW